MGADPATGKEALRSIRIPGEISVQVAQNMCNSAGGEFSPATPLNPQRQLLEEKPCLKSIYCWVDDFEMPFRGVKFSDWSTLKKDALPDSAFAIILSGGRKDSTGRTVPRSLRRLPFKNIEGTINKGCLQSALSKVNQVAASASSKRNALTKLLSFAKAYGMKMQERVNFKVSNLDFLLSILEEAENATAHT